MAIQLFIPQHLVLPDNQQWQFRFTVESASSDRLYIVSQNIKHRHWACSCPGWKRHRHCKHLQALGLPGHEQPFEVHLIKT